MPFRGAAARAAVAFVLANDTEASVLSHLKDLLPYIVKATADSIRSDDDTLLKCMIDLAESAPKYLRPHLDAVLSLCLGALADSTLSDEHRQLALEIAVAMAETAPAMVRKCGKFVSVLIPQVSGGGASLLYITSCKLY